MSEPVRLHARVARAAATQAEPAKRPTGPESAAGTATTPVPPHVGSDYSIAPPIQLARGRRRKLSPAAAVNRQHLLERRERRRAADELAQQRRQQRVDVRNARIDVAKSSFRGGLQGELTSEIDSRDRRRTRHLADEAAKVRALTGDKRPSKPNTLVAKDRQLGNLTAHHLYPYNKIRDDFAAALDGPAGTERENARSNLLGFAGHRATDSSDAYRLMSYQREHAPSERWKKERPRQDARPKSSSTRIESLFKDATWAPHNIFFGPMPADRLDDPHEGLDAHYRSGGQLTPSSALARQVHQAGGFGLVGPAEFHSQLPAARRDAESSRAYEPEDWEHEADPPRRYRQRGRPS